MGGDRVIGPRVPGEHGDPIEDRGELRELQRGRATNAATLQAHQNRNPWQADRILQRRRNPFGFVVHRDRKRVDLQRLRHSPGVDPGEHPIDGTRTVVEREAELLASSSQDGGFTDGPAAADLGRDRKHVLGAELRPRSSGPELRTRPEE